MFCDDCGALERLAIACAELGEGAFLAILCDVCWHRRLYRAELKARLRELKARAPTR